MSGNMYGARHCHWQSDVGEDFVDNDSQFSENSSGVFRARAPDIGYRLRTLIREQKFTDVKFVVNCGLKPKPELYAHKAILAAGSKEFANLFFGTAHQSTTKLLSPIASEFEIKNVSFEAFRNVVEYLYTDDVYFEDNSSVIQTLMAARKFEVLPLVNKCESFLESAELTEEIACMTYQLAIENKIESLKIRCEQFIQENTQGVIRSVAFQSASLATVRSICKMPRLHLRSEEELFEKVLDWVESQKGTPTQKRELLLSVLKHIRFLGIPVARFTQMVQKRPDVFTAEEALNIVMFLTDPSIKSVKLPSWFNKGSNRCSIAQRQAGTPSQFADKKVVFSLRPNIKTRFYVSNMENTIKLKCSEGKHNLKALKFTFGEPVTVASTIGHMTVHISTSNHFSFTEDLQIGNCKYITMPFKKSVLISAGETVLVRAKAEEIRNYFFLQFDESQSMLGDCPFEVELGSNPKENRLFFINEVIYRSLPDRPRIYNNRRHGRMQRGGRRS